jgi:hypothetical protein
VLLGEEVDEVVAVDCPEDPDAIIDEGPEAGEVEDGGGGNPRSGRGI